MTTSNRVLGVMLTAHLICGLILPYVLLLPLTAPPAAFLVQAAGMPVQMKLSVLTLFIGASLPILISVMLYCVYSGRESSSCAALLILSMLSFLMQEIEITHWLTMLSTSEIYALSEDKSGLEVVATVVRLEFKWTHYSHILLAVAWLFSFFHLLFRIRMVPGILAGAGIAACVLHIGGIVLPAFAGFVVPHSASYGIPLALVTLIVSGWLVIRSADRPTATGCPIPDKLP